MKKGFTLVELSIVLVIIGLLIGGILAAQSMSSAAKISAQIAQIQQFDAGVANFKTKYNSLPGDAKVFGGDGDGMLNYPYSDSFKCEKVNFWYSLFPEVYTTGGACPGASQAAYNSGLNQNVPLAKIGTAGAVVIAVTAYFTTDNYYIVAPWPAVDGNSRLYNTVLRDGAWTPSESLAIDTKMDDGLPLSGSVQMGLVSNDNPPGGVARFGLSGLAANCVSGSAYRIGNHPYCTPFIRISSQAGDL